MTQTRARRWVASAGLLALAVTAAAACRRDSNESTPGATGSAATGTATITVKGSDTMVILAQRWAEEYGKGHPGARVQVTGGGSGTGISALINGTTDIATASRAMKPVERQQAEARGGGPVVEIPVAKDGVSVYVNRANPVASLTTAQLAGIYTGKTRRWSEVGGPDRAITLYSRENSSGTYVFFKEHVLGAADFAPSAQTLPGTAAVVNAVERDPGGIGYGGVAYAEGVKIVAVASTEGEPPVAPSKQTVADGSYPLSRPLFFYLRSDRQAAARPFVDWVLSPAGQAVVDKAGYFPIAGATTAAAP